MKCAALFYGSKWDNNMWIKKEKTLFMTTAEKIKWIEDDAKKRYG